MKSLVGFLTEAKKPESQSSSTGSGKGGGGGNNPKPVWMDPNSPEGMKRQAQLDMGSSSYDMWDDTDENIKDPKRKGRRYTDTTSGGPVRTNKPQQKPLGKLYKKGSKTDPKRAGSVRSTPGIERELEAKRRARIDPKTGKATPQGVENYAQNRGGYRRRSIPKADLDQIRKDARRIASDPTSAEYKTIERKINTSDYAGKRAKLATPKELGQIKTDLGKSKTINAKVDVGTTSKAPTNIRTKTTKTPLNTSTRRGKIVNVGSPPTPPPNDPSFRKSVKGPGSSTGYLSKGNLKFSGDDVYNDLKKKIKTTDGRSTNRPKPTPKKFETFRQGNLFGGSNETSSVTQGFRPNDTPDPNIIKKPKNFNPDQGVLDFNQKKPPRKTPKFVGKPSPTNTTVNSKPRSSDYQTRRTPVPTGSKSSSVSQRKGYSIKNDLDALKKLNKKNKVKNIFSGQPSPEPWKPSDAPSVKSRNKVDLDAEFRRKWKTAQEKWKSDGVSPENVSKTKNKFKYDSPSMKKPSIRSYTSPTLKPLNFKPSSSGGGFKPPGGDGTTTKTKSKVTSNYSTPKYKKPSPWKRLKNWRKGGMPGLVPAAFGIAGGIDMAQQQKERGATTSRQIKTGLLSGASDAASWVTASSLANWAFKKRPILKLATQIAGSSYISNQIDKVTSKYYDSPTKAEIKAGKDAETITYEKWRKKNKAFLIPGAGRDKKQSSPSLVGGFAANQSGKLNPNYGK